MNIDELEKALVALGACDVAIDERNEDAQLYVKRPRKVVAECKDATDAKLLLEALTVLPGLLRLARAAEFYVRSKRCGYYDLEDAVLALKLAPPNTT